MVFFCQHDLVTPLYAYRKKGASAVYLESRSRPHGRRPMRYLWTLQIRRGNGRSAFVQEMRGYSPRTKSSCGSFPQDHSFGEKALGNRAGLFQVFEKTQRTGSNHTPGYVSSEVLHRREETLMISSFSEGRRVPMRRPFRLISQCRKMRYNSAKWQQLTN